MDADLAIRKGIQEHLDVVPGKDIQHPVGGLVRNGLGGQVSLGLEVIQEHAVGQYAGGAQPQRLQPAVAAIGHTGRGHREQRAPPDAFVQQLDGGGGQCLFRVEQCAVQVRHIERFHLHRSSAFL